MTARTLGVVLLLLIAGVWIADLKDQLELQKAQYETRIAVLAQEVSEENTTRAQAVADAERAARETLQHEAERMASLAAELDATRTQMAKDRRLFDAQIKAVSVAAARDCAGLPAAWVRLYNEALDLSGADSGSTSQGTGAAGTAQAPGQARAATTGVQPDALTTPEDVLAHIRDYGGYCRSLEAQTRALVKVAQ